MSPRKLTPAEGKAVPIMVRLPPDLHQWLVSRAEKELRSLNAQIIVFLQELRDLDENAMTVEAD